MSSSSDVPDTSHNKTPEPPSALSILTRNPFINFMREYRASHPELKGSAGEIIKYGAEIWRNMSPEDKLPYRTSARQAPKRRRSRTRSRSRRRRSRRRTWRSRSRKRRRMRRGGLLKRRSNKKRQESSTSKQENSNQSNNESNRSSKSDHARKDSRSHFCVRCKKADPPKNRSGEQKNQQQKDGDVEENKDKIVKICSQCHMECENCKKIKAERDQSSPGTSKAPSGPDFSYLT